jgi:hypothetical protein
MYAWARSFTNSLLSSPPSAARISITRFICVTFKFGAANRVRTGDIHVGNVMLYQLSYSRIKIFITGSHFMCYHYTNTADQAVPGIRTRPVFFTERFNKIAEKNLSGQK